MQIHTCMCVYIYVYICMYIYVYMYTYILYTYHQSGKLSGFMTFLGGIFAGTVETIAVVTPSEMLKIRLQTEKGSGIGSIGVLVNILRKEGPLALYKGMLPTWFRQSTNQGCRFVLYGRVTDYLRAVDSQQKQRHWHSFLAGALAGGINVYVNNFADVVKTRMQNQGPQLSSSLKPIYSSSWDCLKRIVREEGILALWTGSTPRVVRLVPGQAITFGVFGYFEKLLRPQPKL
ncbi:hypothetical protein AAMO2058_000201800 [Amorphochlora amoebiformis]